MTPDDDYLDVVSDFRQSSSEIPGAWPDSPAPAEQLEEEVLTMDSTSEAEVPPRANFGYPQDRRAWNQNVGELLLGARKLRRKTQSPVSEELSEQVRYMINNAVLLSRCCRK